MIEALAGPSALVAAGATVLGAVFLVLFFQRGRPWGALNDIASIVLMAALIPVAIWFTDLQTAGVEVEAPVAAVGVAGMVIAAFAQLLLVLRVRTYEQLLPYTLGGGAIVGVWYVLVAMLGLGPTAPALLRILALASGVGFIAVAYGFWRWGQERHPISIGGGVLLLVASTAFLGWVGVAATAVRALSA